MPEIINPSPNDVCYYCGNLAFYISVNTKRKRCSLSTNKCPAIIHKQTSKRNQKYSKQEWSIRMKRLSEKGNAVLAEKFKDPDYLSYRQQLSREYVRSKGGHRGSNNPHFNRIHSQEAKAKMRDSASRRDNTNIGKYIRTDYHRNLCSIRLTQLMINGKLFKSSNTKPEQMTKNILNLLRLTYVPQFLIQEGWLGGTKPWFRHAYDFKIDNTSLIIEVDGDYWHSSATQKERDQKCIEKAHERGFFVLRIREHDLYHNYDQTVKIIQSLIIISNICRFY